jgi:hypothetical protein
MQIASTGLFWLGLKALECLTVDVINDTKSKLVGYIYSQPKTEVMIIPMPDIVETPSDSLVNDEIRSLIDRMRTSLDPLMSLFIILDCFHRAVDSPTPKSIENMSRTLQLREIMNSCINLSLDLVKNNEEKRYNTSIESSEIRSLLGYNIVRVTLYSEAKCLEQLIMLSNYLISHVLYRTMCINELLGSSSLKAQTSGKSKNITIAEFIELVFPPSQPITSVKNETIVSNETNIIEQRKEIVNKEINIESINTAVKSVTENSTLFNLNGIQSKTNEKDRFKENNLFDDSVFINYSNRTRTDQRSHRF